jgi:hypothetical protein
MMQTIQMPAEMQTHHTLSKHAQTAYFSFEDGLLMPKLSAHLMFLFGLLTLTL